MHLSQTAKSGRWVLLGVLAALALAMAALHLWSRPVRLSPEAASFKNDVLILLQANCQDLASLTAGSDQAAARQKIAELVAAGKEHQAPLIYGLALVKSDGEILAAESPSDDPLLKNYIAMLQANQVRIPKVAEEALEQKRITSARLYMQDGSQLWVICCPLKQGRQVVGALLVGCSGQWCRQKRGLSGEEFSAIDFNK